MILNTLRRLFLNLRIAILEHDIAEWEKASKNACTAARKVIGIEQLSRQADLIVLKARLDLLTR